MPLAEVVEDVTNGFACGLRDDSGVIQLRMNNVNANGSLDWTSITRVPRDYKDLLPYTLRPNDVLFNNTNSAALVGKSALFHGHKEPVVFSNHFTRLRSKSDLLLPQFLAYWLRLQWNARIFERGCNRWIGQAAFKWDKLLKLSIVLPSIDEQNRLVHILGVHMAAVEKARAAAEVRLEAAKALRGAYLREVFASGESNKWEHKPLSQIAEIAGGIQKTPNRRPVRFHRPYLTVRNVQRGYLDLSHVDRFEITRDELSRLRLQKGDLLIVEGNGSKSHIGRNALFEGSSEEWIHQNHIIRVRLDPKQCSFGFVSWFLNSEQGKQQMLERARTTSGLFTLSTGKVGSLTVPVPSLEEQRSAEQVLCDTLKKVNQIQETLEEEVEALAMLPASILRKAFTGEL